MSRPALFVLLLALLFSGPAYAYLDPGTGSYLVQALIAGMLGFLYFFKSARLYLLHFFSRLFGGKTDDTSEK